MIDGARAAFGLSADIQVFYVERMSLGNVGEDFRPGNNAALANSAVVADGADATTLAHELGHILLDDGTHRGDASRLMGTLPRTDHDFTCTECDTMR